MGFAPASLLHRYSFADVLDEETGRGYQRRFNRQHSLDFRRYIQRERSTTIPLTFNLRPCTDDGWKIRQREGQRACLKIAESAGKVLAQVDCQHRLGHLADQDILLPFMCFIGLSEIEEMEIFGVINGKAKGLSTSLLDYHDAQLTNDLAAERPELFIALLLNNDARSPWHRLLDLGGKSTSGLARRASLRTVQKAVKRFLTQTRTHKGKATEDIAEAVVEYWAAIAQVLERQWANPRKHFLTKGIGVYALMDLAADLVLEVPKGTRPNRQYFENILADFIAEIDWSRSGPLKGLGGETGAKAAIDLIRLARKKSNLRVVSHG